MKLWSLQTDFVFNKKIKNKDLNFQEKNNWYDWIDFEKSTDLNLCRFKT